MTPNDVVTFFGSQTAAARAVGTTPQAVNKWIAQDKVPPGRQFQFQLLTRGKLRASVPIGPRARKANKQTCTLDVSHEM